MAVILNVVPAPEHYGGLTFSREPCLFQRLRFKTLIWFYIVQKNTQEYSVHFVAFHSEDAWKRHGVPGQPTFISINGKGHCGAGTSVKQSRNLTPCFGEHQRYISIQAKRTTIRVLLRSYLCRVTCLDDMSSSLGEQTRRVVSSLRTKWCGIQPEIQSPVTAVL